MEATRECRDRAGPAPRRAPPLSLSDAGSLYPALNLSHSLIHAPLLDSREMCDFPRKARPLCRRSQWVRATVETVGF